MTDFEINKRLAELLGYVVAQREAGRQLVWVSYRDPKGSVVKVQDYCNNPSDMWPIIQRLRIELSYYGSEAGGYCTTDTSFFIDFKDGGELRAAALTAIKVLENTK